MNEQERVLVETVMDMISHAAEMMLKDPYYATPAWIIENWWHTLNAAITSSSSSNDEQDA